MKQSLNNCVFTTVIKGEGKVQKFKLHWGTHRRLLVKWNLNEELTSDRERPPGKEHSSCLSPKNLSLYLQSLIRSRCSINAYGVKFVLPAFQKSFLRKQPLDMGGWGGGGRKSYKHTEVLLYM